MQYKNQEQSHRDPLDVDFFCRLLVLRFLEVRFVYKI